MGPFQLVPLIIIIIATTIGLCHPGPVAVNHDFVPHNQYHLSHPVLSTTAAILHTSIHFISITKYQIPSISTLLPTNFLYHPNLYPHTKLSSDLIHHTVCSPRSAFYFSPLSSSAKDRGQSNLHNEPQNIIHRSFFNQKTQFDVHSNQNLTDHSPIRTPAHLPSCTTKPIPIPSSNTSEQPGKPKNLAQNHFSHPAPLSESTSCNHTFSTHVLLFCSTIRNSPTTPLPFPSLINLQHQTTAKTFETHPTIPEIFQSETTSPTAKKLTRCLFHFPAHTAQRTTKPIRFPSNIPLRQPNKQKEPSPNKFSHSASQTENSLFTHCFSTCNPSFSLTISNPPAEPLFSLPSSKLLHQSAAKNNEPHASIPEISQFKATSPSFRKSTRCFRHLLFLFFISTSVISSPFSHTKTTLQKNPKNAANPSAIIKIYPYATFSPPKPTYHVGMPTTLHKNTACIVFIYSPHLHSHRN